jgi:hypothetical protein
MVTAAARWTPAALLVVALSGCGAHRVIELTPGPEVTATVTPTPTITDTPGATAEPTGEPTATEDSPSATPSAESGALANGKHPAYLTGVDVAGAKVTVDVVQFFTGSAAAEAAKQDGATEVPPPNDYWIRNANKLLRTLPVAADATITVNTLAGETSGNSAKDVTVDLAQLAGYNLANHLFWVTVEDGRITRIAEQFLP